MNAKQDDFWIEERDDDMLICVRDWRLGFRCIARRPKLISNNDWRPVAEQIVSALIAGRSALRQSTEAGGE